ncbi:MAG: type II toxin-antitoxin system HicB family antitoxin [Lachnospiraceae bacterium]|nr:type II toxin-antitoxin system HicB family antitoxin [Lachnospiraceae bacterium]MBR1852672.1 type II toxin-antitoxin system HicB family antitoxin [Lachnospiraceae bacterium]
MKGVYPVIFTKTNENILVEIPDWEIFTEGKDIADAIEMARDAIGLKGVVLEDEGKELVKPSLIHQITSSKSVFDGEGESIISMVDVDFTEYRRKNENKAVRRNVTIPNWLNLEVERAHINVSRVLQEALMAKLNIYR